MNKVCVCVYGCVCTVRPASARSSGCAFVVWQRMLLPRYILFKYTADMNAHGRIRTETRSGRYELLHVYGYV